MDGFLKCLVTNEPCTDIRDCEMLGCQKALTISQQVIDAWNADTCRRSVKKELEDQRNEWR